MRSLSWCIAAVLVLAAGAGACNRRHEAPGVVPDKHAVESAEADEGAATATSMRLEFALLQDGQRVVEDTLTLTSTSQAQTYHATTGDKSRAFVVMYTFAQPASTLGVEGPKWKAGVAIGVHRSTEWEEIAIGDGSATLLYKCTPLP